MREISFSIPVSGTIRIDDNSVTIIVNKTETVVTLGPGPDKEGRGTLPKGMTVFDVLLATAQEFVRSTGESRFSAADLYHEAAREYPGLRRNTWTAHAIASAPNHPSYRHHSSKRDYFRYLGEGTYQLTPKYAATANTKEE